VDRRRVLEPAALAHDVRGLPAGTNVTILEVLDIGYLVEAFDEAGDRIDVFFASDEALRDR
jgi:hypothetical protein